MTPDPSKALVGLDGLEFEAPAPPHTRRGTVALTLSAEAAERMRDEIARAGGREVCFLARLDAQRRVVEPRAVARGNHAAVLAAAHDEPQGGIMLHNHPSGTMEPSDADLQVAARLWDEGLGTAIIDNLAEQLYVVVEPPEPRERVPLDLDALESVVRPGGALAGRHPGYEDRAGQREMLRAVAERYNEGGVLFVEAGTGTGKSVAYLVPAARWALDNEERTVISTATINLQQQLATRDLPLVAKLLAGSGAGGGVGAGAGAGLGEGEGSGADAEGSAPAEGSEAAEATAAGAAVAGTGAENGTGATAGDGAEIAAAAGADAATADLTWALVKGRGNYISIRRLELAAASSAELFETDRSRELDALREWVRVTDDGSLADLPAPPSDDVWDEVRSDPDVCLRVACPHFQECFYQRSRRRAASARILVVNHHLLFTDLAVRRATRNWSQAAVLPAWRHVILDEAHNVEDAATSHLGVEVTRSGMYRTLARLERRGRGLLSSLQSAVGLQTDAARAFSREIEERVRPHVESTRARIDAFVECLEPLLRGAASDEDATAVRIRNGSVPGEPDPADASMVDGGFDDGRLAADPSRAPGGARTEGLIDEPMGDPAIHDATRELLAELQGLERDLRRLTERIDESEELSEAVGARLLDVRSVERRLGAAQVALKVVLDPGQEAVRWVRWLELRGRGRRRNLALAAAPIELGPDLRDALWARAETAILSSATLTTRQRFDFVRERLGVDADGLLDLESPPVVEERRVGSPFDFARQTVLAVPRDLPRAGQGADFNRATADVVESFAATTRGGLFVLFTSYRALQSVARLLRERGVDRRWPLFVHGEADRGRLLHDFVQHGDGLLLGTASFWEGVDVPGDPLRGLVIQKLPFRVPTEPVVAARIEALEARGANAFWSYMLPLAALRLKQGFGRLIRSRADRGAVVLLDDRVLTRRYGRYLIDSLPDAPLIDGPWAHVHERLRDFYLAPEPGAEGIILT